MIVPHYVYSFEFRRNCARTNESSLFEALGNLFRAKNTGAEGQLEEPENAVDPIND